MPKVNPTVVTLAIAGVLAVAFSLFVNSASQSVSGGAHATTPAARPLWAASATGRVEPKGGEIRIASSVPGKIVEVTAKTNDLVTEGDLLVRLDDDDFLSKVAAAKAETQVRVRERDEEDAKGLALDRRRAEDAVAAAERELFDAREAFDEITAKVRAGRGNADDVTKARNRLAEAKSKLSQERASLATINAKPGMPLPTRLESGLAVARAELSAAESAAERTRIRAPSDGTVLNMIAKVGETAAPSPDSPVVIFGDLTALRVRAEVEERDTPRVHVKQRVVVRADAYPNKDFEGQVSSISQSLSAPRIASRGARRPNDVEVLEVMADLDGLPPLLTGMRVDVFFKLDATAGSDSSEKTN